MPKKAPIFTFLEEVTPFGFSFTCPHCSETLPVNNNVVSACCCKESEQARLEAKERTKYMANTEKSNELSFFEICQQRKFSNVRSH